MTRLLLIGNSHLAAFRHGWDRIKAAYPSVQIDFFALSGGEYYSLRLSADGTQFGALDEGQFTNAQLQRLDKLNAMRVIDVTGYDQVMVVGNQHGLADLLKVIAHRDVDDLRLTGARHRLSAAAFDAVIDDLAEAFLPDVIWDGFTAAPLTFHAMPRPAETVFAKVDVNGPLAVTYANIEENPQGVAEAFDRLAVRVADRQAAKGWRFIEQPQALMTPLGFTHGHFNASLDSFSGQRMNLNSDYSHMNAAYGAACLHAAFPDFVPDASVVSAPDQKETTNGLGS